MNALLKNLKERAKKVSRKKKDEFFYSLCPREAHILDVGVYPEGLRGHNLGISTNHFLKEFRYPSKYYTGLSIDSMEKMEDIYKGKKFVKYDGGRFPFEDKQFDWVYSNAVIEHVGNYKSRLTFVKEMVRVAKNVFFTTPNKFFPVDAHTMVFFKHWNEEKFMEWRRRNNKWMPEDSLHLLSYDDLVTVLNEAKVKNYKIIRNRFFGMTMTFTVVIHAPERGAEGAKQQEKRTVETTA